MGRRYSQKTLGLLWGKSGGKCAYPGCKNELIIKEIDEIIGNICHIVSLNGPRGDAQFSQDKLNEYDNLVLMCRHHHGLIDIDEKTNTIDKLKKIKRNHETYINQKLEYGKPWKSNIAQIYYVNIPRLNILSFKEEIFVDTNFLKEYKNLHEMGYGLNKLFIEYQPILDKITPCALAIEEITSINLDLIGLTLSFDCDFRTKNNPGLDDFCSGKFKLKGDLKKDPQLYTSLLGFKLILTIDPTWLTTTTSFVNFRMGRGNFAGIATIKDVLIVDKIIIATPLLIGLRKSPFDRILRSDNLSF